jgi:hypothetical protein
MGLADVRAERERRRQNQIEEYRSLSGRPDLSRDQVDRLVELETLLRLSVPVPAPAPPPPPRAQPPVDSEIVIITQTGDDFSFDRGTIPAVTPVIVNGQTKAADFASRMIAAAGE